MKLEEGKFYRDGMGAVVGPMVLCDKVGKPFRDKLTVQSYTRSGRFFSSRRSKRDLIEEVPGNVVTLHCGETDQWCASETPDDNDTLKITFNIIGDKADPSSVRMELI